MSFTVSGNNGGMIVTPDFYLQERNKGNVGAGIIDSALSNEEYGFSISDTVEMMVAAQMGALIPEKQSAITNANIQQGALSQFEATISMLSKNTIKPLNQKNALTSYEISNSNPNAIRADISKSGASGSLDLSIGVTQLAQSQSLKFSGFNSENDALKAGTFTIDFGQYNGGNFTENANSSSITVEIKDGMTLSDLAGEINKLTKDIKATIVTNSDGSTGLALISQKTGEQNAMRVTTSGDSSLTTFDYNGTDSSTATQVREPADAIYTVNGIQMTSDTNKIEDVFGLNLTLNEVTNGEVRIGTTVSPQGVIDNVYAFVENYNAMIDMYNSFNSENPDEDFVGSINGSKVSEAIEDEINKLFSVISSDGKSLKDIGVTRDPDGRLSLNQDKLGAALELNPEIAYEILGTTTKSSHTGVNIEDLGNSVNGDHTIVITRAPEKAKLTGAALLSNNTIAADTELKLKLGNKEVTIPISVGDYTPEQLAANINKEINLAGISGYKASIDGGALSINSAEYGSLKSIEVLSDVPELGLLAQKATGTDVAGTINGESFLGDGAEFESKFDEASKGMKVTFDPEKITLNQQITISTNKGFLDNLDATINNIKKSTTSEIKEIKESLDKTRNDSLVTQLEDLQNKEDYYYNMYYQQFSGISAALSEMEGTIKMMEMMFESDK
ncbi:flagellar filament capping protein FliD [Vibrio vulnificus]|nr:flagellar filament capping protein FliD [Vibrio vulnificus]